MKCKRGDNSLFNSRSCRVLGIIIVLCDLVLRNLVPKNVDDRHTFWEDGDMSVKGRSKAGSGVRERAEKNVGGALGGGKNKSQLFHNLKIWDFAKWDAKIINEFDNLLISLESTPSSKILITQMVKCSWLYEPVKPGPFSFDQGGVVASINAYRESRRAKLYLLDKDLIKTADSGGGKTLYLTSRGQKIFYEEYPLALLREQKWDGNWVVVAYDFPETLRGKRNYLRKKLIHLGFGSPQESLLISPLPLAEAVENLIEGEKAGDNVWVLRAKRVLGLENTEVARKAWNLDKINDLYGKLLEIWPRIGNVKGKTLKKEWQQLFLAVDLADPYLPFELLSEDWLGEKCRKQVYGSGFLGFVKNLFAL